MFQGTERTLVHCTIRTGFRQVCTKYPGNRDLELFPPLDTVPAVVA